MPYFDQATAICRCEWGPVGLESLTPADVVIVVDVLSFSTCVDVAVGRGVAILPYRWKDATAEAFAASELAELARPRGQGRYSLSPSSFQDAPRGTRCVLPSPNGATLSLRAAETGAAVLTGCLRNARAVAKAAQALGTTFNVCPAGERWSDGTVRFAVEDWLAAGAILRHLPWRRSPEAEAAMAAFERSQGAMLEALMASSSGRELIERDFQLDVECAAHVDASERVPRLVGNSFVDVSGLAV
jgi:2-phosphosulfolactate phosphatase